MCVYLKNKWDKQRKKGILHNCLDYKLPLKSTENDFIYRGKFSGSILFHLTTNQHVGSFTSILFYMKRSMIYSYKILSSSWSGEQNYVQKLPEKRMHADKLHSPVTFVDCHS